jgi:hypothetical protein
VSALPEKCSIVTEICNQDLQIGDPSCTFGHGFHAVAVPWARAWCLYIFAAGCLHELICRIPVPATASFLN